VFASSEKHCFVSPLRPVPTQPRSANGADFRPVVLRFCRCRFCLACQSRFHPIANVDLPSEKRRDKVQRHRAHRPVRPCRPDWAQHQVTSALVLSFSRSVRRRWPLLWPPGLCDRAPKTEFLLQLAYGLYPRASEHPRMMTMSFCLHSIISILGDSGSAAFR